MDPTRNKCSMAEGGDAAGVGPLPLMGYKPLGPV